jgi:hypothetical protein
MSLFPLPSNNILRIVDVANRTTTFTVDGSGDLTLRLAPDLDEEKGMIPIKNSTYPLFLVRQDVHEPSLSVKTSFRGVVLAK